MAPEHGLHVTSLRVVDAAAQNGESVRACHVQDHYGRWGSIMFSMRPYLIIVIALLELVAIAHLLRIVTNCSLIIADVDIPMWVSWVTFIVLEVLVLIGIKLVAHDR